MVYGPANHSRSPDFLKEMFAKVSNSLNPIVIGGDFNLLQMVEDKSKQIINDQGLVDRFSEWVADLALTKLQRVGARFTWTNN